MNFFFNYFYAVVGSRITTIFNFGYVSLNILHLRVEDTGLYTLRAVNRWGEAISQSTIRVIGKFCYSNILKVIHEFLKILVFFYLYFFISLFHLLVIYLYRAIYSLLDFFLLI